MSTGERPASDVNSLPLPPDLVAASATATRLLDTAERLFAQHGIDNVSMRQIVQASGQSNQSAAHYHFGSRDTLIRTLIERRMEVIDRLRHERLDALLADGHQPTPAELVATGIGTIARVVSEWDWGPDYVRVMAQALFHPALGLPGSIDAQRRSGLIRTIEHLRRALPELPDAAFADRIELLQHETVYAIARWVHRHEAVTPANRADFDAHVARITDFMVAGMSAPESPAGG